jgi:hypothetical protein
MENLPHVGLLLRQIKRNGTIDPLLASGLTFSQIATLIQEARSAGLVNRESLQLTERGEVALAAVAAAGEKPVGWIRPADEYRIETIGIDEVFLPDVAPNH